MSGYTLLESSPAVRRVNPGESLLTAHVFEATGFTLGLPVWAAVVDANMPQVAITRRRVLAWDKLLVHTSGLAVATWRQRDLSADLADVKSVVHVRMGYAAAPCGPWLMFAGESHVFEPGDDVRAELKFNLKLAP